LVLHLGGFALRDGVQTPEIWFIRNAHGHEKGEYNKIDLEFECSEEFWKYQLRGDPPEPVPATQIRNHLAERAANFTPFDFHQGTDLTIFNVLELFIRSGLRQLSLGGHPALRPPETLRDWERYFRLYVLSYGAYFQAFNHPGEQTVGGGADIASLPWP